ncbi:MAG: hypothetical protein ABIG55_06125, partial [Candidatus Omnitrophota bacterium]
MMNNNVPNISPSLQALLANIEEAKRLNRESESVKVAAVVSGNKNTCQNWQKRLTKTGPHIFNKDGSTLILSLEEKIGSKDKEGNFLGTLLAYRYIKEAAEKKGIGYLDTVSLIGMLLGRGERISPITQALGCNKACIKVTPADIEIDGGKIAFTAIEEALLHFIPVAKYLEKRGFRGILNKWGDQTEIASIDLTLPPEDNEIFSEHDIIKFVSIAEVTEEDAKHKDWVVFDQNNNVTAQVSRNERDVLIKELNELGVQADEEGRYCSGISLGPIAVSYKVLDIASDVFEKEIKEEGVHVDFDPYFLMAMAMEEKHLDKWEEIAAKNKGLRELLKMVPDLFDKAQRIKNKFGEKYGKALNFKVLDLGKDIYWADIGQHSAMREKYSALNNAGEKGEVARRLAGIEGERDFNGNIIKGSDISREIEIKNSVIVASRITGRGRIENSVIIDSKFKN